MIGWNRVRWLAAVLAVLAAGCGGKKDGNRAPQPVIVEPHESSTQFPGGVDFEGRASDPEDGALAATALRWEIRNEAGDIVGAFSGAAQTLNFPAAGTYDVYLFATDSRGKEGVSQATFKVGNTIAEIRDPDNYGFVGISTPFDVEGHAETQAVGVFLQTLTFVGTDRATNAEVFRLPVAAPANSTVFTTVVTPSVPAGSYELRLELTTTSATESAEDRIFVLADAAPVVSITSPADGSRVAPGASISFSGTAIDPAGDELTLRWSSSIEGSLSTDLSFTKANLLQAKHTITLTATDPNGLTGSASVDLYIEDSGNPLFVDAGNLPNPDVRSLAAEPVMAAADRIWVGTAAGIHSYGADTVAQVGVAHTAGYNVNGQAPILAARWIGSGERVFGGDGIGVSIRDAGDTTWSTFDAVADPLVYGIAQSPMTDQLIFATDAGLTVTAENRSAGVDLDTGILNRAIFDVTVDATGTVWAGGDGEGLIRITLPSTVSNFTDAQGLADNVVNAVAVDGDGNVWAGTDDGISRLDVVGSTITTWRGELPSNRVLAIAVDADGIVWAGTESGAVRFDPVNERWTVLDDTDLAGRQVNAVLVDSAGAKWFGCGPAGGTTGGLTRYIGE